MDPRGIISFADFKLDPVRGTLSKSDAPVTLEPKVLDLITWFVTHPGQLMSRDDLIEHVWNGRIVSDSAISSAVNAARKALGDSGGAQRFIRTVPRRGFRFEADVAPALSRPPGKKHDRPAVAVLPFENQSGDPEQTYFSDGMTDDIITELSRYPELFVVARHSSFAFRDSQKPIDEIAHSLGVSYIVEGAVRRSGNRIRVTARLIDPEGGDDLWSERYDRDFGDVFAVQDDIGAVIVNTLVGAITRQHHRRVGHGGRETATAYDHFLRALDLNYRMEPAKAREARAEAQLALDTDPRFSRAHALVAWTHISDASNAWAPDTREALARAKVAGLAGVAADDQEPFAHAVLGWVYIWSDKAFDRGLEEQRRAVETNPGNAQFRSMLAFSMTYAGQSEAALIALEEAMRLNPYFPELFHVFCGRALFNLRRYGEAMPRLERVRTTQPHHANALAHTAACYAALGRRDEARDTVAEVRRASSGYTLSHARDHVAYADPEERAHFIHHLEAAGLA